MAMPGLSAVDSILSVKVDGEADTFLVLGMTGHEHLSEMFEYNIELAGQLGLLDTPKDIDLHDLLGKQATLVLKAGSGKRHFDGIVTRAARGERRGRFVTYTITVKPWIWFMTRTKNSQVFQDKSVKDVVTDLLAPYSGYDSAWRLKSEGDYPKLDYCVQYNETDYDFMNRLLEEVGIYFYFEHGEGKHTLVLLDSMAKHPDRPGGSKISQATAMTHDATIMNWHTLREARAAAVELTEFDYLAPSTKISGTETASNPPKKVGKMEWFEHPALVVQNSAKPDATDASAMASARAAIRMQELVSLDDTATGTSNALDMGVGVVFEIDATQDDDSGKWMVVNLIYRLDFANNEAVEDLRSERPREGFRCDFLAMRAESPAVYREPRITAKPVIAGPLTATVTGKTDNEIETDIHGRIKVHFHWDREGKIDQTSSCWVRVVQPWASKGYGMFWLPRVKDEVVVQFIDGDPDRPIVTGSVYNKENAPIWKLPDNATVTGLKTRSSKSGTADTAHELRFEDLKDKEYIWFQSQKDFRRIVKNDAFDWVGNNENIKVVLTRKEVIGENWFMDITKDVMHNMGKDLHVNVAGDIFYTGMATFQLDLTKDFNAKIGGDVGYAITGKTQIKGTGDIALESGGKLSLKATADLMAEGKTISIKGASSVAIESDTAISLKVGGSIVSVSSSGVDIVGQVVNVNSGGGAGAATAALSASPTAPTKAKKEDTITPEKKDDYQKLFDDPMPKDTAK